MATPSVTITANLQSVTGSADAASVTFELVNYQGTVPRVSGTCLILQTSFTAVGDGSGNISVQLWGEEQVTPSGTYYTATFFNDAGGQVASVAYQFTGPGTFDLSNVVPMGQQVVAAQQPNSAIPQIFSPVSHQFLTGMNSLGVFSSAQPSFTDISGVIGSGQLPNPSATTLGGVKSLAAVSHQFLTSIGTNGLPVAAQPAASDLSNGTTGSGAVVLAASPTLSGTTNTGNLIVNPSATGSGAALTVGGTSSTTGGISIFIGALGSQTERAAIYPADGITSALRIGALSVRTAAAGFLTGTEVAKIDTSGNATATAFRGDGSVSAPSHSFASETNSGWFWQQLGIIGFGIQGSYLQQHTAVRVGYAPGVVLGWAPSAPNSASNDTSLSRVSAGVVGVGTGSGTGGTIQAAIFQGTASNSFTVGNVSGTQRVLFNSANSTFEYEFLNSSNGIAGVQIAAVDAFELTGGTSAAGHARLWADSTSHFWKANNNAGSSYNLVGDTTTQTLTNKRLTPRLISTTNASAGPLTLTADSDNFDVNAWVLTGTAGTITIAAPTGTPTDGQRLTLRIKTTNSWTYSFVVNFAFSTSVTTPTTTTAGKTDYIGVMWNATNSKWDVVAVDQGH